MDVKVRLCICVLYVVLISEDASSSGSQNSEVQE